MAKPVLEEIHNLLLITKEEPLEYFAGHHFVVHMINGDLVKITGEGNRILLNAEKVLFLGGQNYDVVIATEKDKKLTIYTIQGKEANKIHTFSCQILTSAHFTLDRFLVMVIDYRVYIFDLSLGNPEKCALLGFSLPADAVTTVNSHLFYVWTRSALYRVDLLSEIVTPLQSAIPSKVSLNPPLDIGQTFVFAKSNLAVSLGDAGLSVYNATGQVIFEDREKIGLFKEVKGLCAGTCAFTIGDSIYYLKNHQIFCETALERVSESAFFIGDTGYCIENGQLTSLFDVTTLPKSKLVISLTSQKIYEIKGTRITAYTLQNAPAVASSYSMGSWPNKSPTNFALLFKPFLYQVDNIIFLWRLEDGPIPNLGLRTIDSKGISSPRVTYPILSIAQDAITSAIWKSTRDFVVLQISTKIFIFEALTGTVRNTFGVSPEVKLRTVHSFGAKIWISLGPERGSQITKLWHIDLVSGKSTPMAAGLLDLAVTETRGYSHKEAVIGFSPAYKKAVVIYPPGDSQFPKSQVFEEIEAVADGPFPYMLIGKNLKNLNNGILQDFGQLPDIDIGEVSSLHIGKKNITVIGKDGYCYGNLHALNFLKMVVIDSRQDQIRLLVVDNEKVDPNERTAVIYNGYYMWSESQSNKMYKTVRSDGTGKKFASFSNL